MSINVIVFHGNGCGACHEEMEFLEREKIPFVARNVSTDLGARAELIGMGSKTVPTTLVGGDMIVGFDLARLKSALRI